MIAVSEHINNTPTLGDKTTNSMTVTTLTSLLTNDKLGVHDMHGRLGVH